MVKKWGRGANREGATRKAVEKEQATSTSQVSIGERRAVRPLVPADCTHRCATRGGFPYHIPEGEMYRNQGPDCLVLPMPTWLVLLACFFHCYLCTLPIKGNQHTE